MDHILGPPNAIRANSTLNVTAFIISLSFFFYGERCNGDSQPDILTFSKYRRIFGSASPVFILTPRRVVSLIDSHVSTKRDKYSVEAENGTMRRSKTGVAEAVLISSGRRPHSIALTFSERIFNPRISPNIFMIDGRFSS